jgi:S-adenosylmethionine:tRNA ribosyltransferase-isomerase
MHNISDYDYELPPGLLAKNPCERRDGSRLMVIDRTAGTIEHLQFHDLPALVRDGDCLVMNNTKVLRARLFGTRKQTGGRWEGLFLSSTPDGNWRLIGETRGKLQPGELLSIHPAYNEASPARLDLQLVARDGEGTWTVRPDSVEDTERLLERFGTLPLPPYIGRKLAEESDFDRYQTIYAREPGAVAAPTAGLHFTPQLLADCRDSGATTTEVTLHVGIGTFRPISVEQLDDHRMHSEWCKVSCDAAERIANARQSSGRVVAVGTTSVRTLESAAQNGTMSPWSGTTDLFIRPGYKFKAVDALITNFHLPKSSLLVLVSAFAGHDLMKRAYAVAIENRYRFYSYGDAMLIV